MKTLHLFVAGVFLYLTATCFASQLIAQQQSNALAISAYSRLPLSFEKNYGQAPGEVKYLSRGPGYLLLLTKDGAQIVLRDKRKQARLRMKLLQAGRGSSVTGEDIQPGYTNYLFADDPERSRGGIPNYGKVRYGNLYSGIDLVYHGDRQRLEYDFILAPGADPKRIALQFEEADHISIDSNGDLVITTAAGELREPKPVAYQDIDGRRNFVDVSYLRRGEDVFGFQLGAYDKNKKLVIDPVLTFSTYIGGSLDEQGMAVAVDPSGFVYVAGSTTSFDFPTQHHISFCHPFDDPFEAPCINPFVVKLDPNGRTVVYATYFVVTDGGARAIAVDGAGNVYLTGNTDTGVDAANRSNAFVAKIDSSGSRLLYSKNVTVPLNTIKQPFHSAGEAIAVDGIGNAYVTGNYNSSVFVVKLDPNGNSLWAKALESTTSFDSGTGLGLDAAGSVYVAGYAGKDFPTTAGAFETSCGAPPSNTCGFVAKMDGQGNSVLYSTFLNDASITDLVVNAVGNAYVTGFTSSAAFPSVNAIQPTLAACTSNADCQDAFVTEFNTSGSGLVFSTYLGGSGTDSAQAITLDTNDDIYVAGYTSSVDFPTANPIQATFTPGTLFNAFVTKLNPSASDLLYSTYLGGSYNDAGFAIATDNHGSVYVAGNAISRNFPTVRAIQPLLGGNNGSAVAPAPAAGSHSNAFVVRIGDSNGTPTLVQFNSMEGTATGSMSAAFPGKNAAGNLIIAVVRMSTTSQTVTLTDTAGNSYADAVSQAQISDGHRIHIFYAANIHGGANSVRATFSGINTHPWLAIYEYSGLVTANPLDQIARAQGNDTSPFTGLITTTNANELEFAVVGLPASYTGMANPGPGYSLLAQDTGSSRAATEAAALNAIGQYAGRFNLSSATNWSAVVATFTVAPVIVPPPSITASALRNAVQNGPYGDVLTVTNGKLPYTWSVIAGSLPAGLALDATTGVISGTATVIATSNFTVQVSDANFMTDTRALSITVFPIVPAPTVTTTSLPSAVQGQPYSATLAASGGIPPYTWALAIHPFGAFGDFPDGLVLNPTTGVISGTPTDGSSSFLVVVTDAANNSAISNPLTISVNTAGSINLIQSNAAMGTGVTSLSAAFPTINTASNTIVAFVRMSSSGQTVTLTDTAGNTYTDAVSQVQSADGHQIHLFYASNIKGGSNAVRASFSSTNNHPWLAIYEYAGTLHTDRTATAQGSGTAVSSGLTAMTTSANELVFAGVGLPSSSTSPITAGGGFTPLQQNLSGSPAGNESQVVSLTGSYAGSFTLSTSQNWSAIVATFSVTNVPPLPASINRIQANAAEATGVPAVSVPFNATTAAGDMIIAFVRMSTTSQAVTVTDTAGNTYTDAVSQVQSADGSQIHIFYAAKIKGGANTVTANFSGTNNHPFLAIYEYSGVTALDSAAHAQGSGTNVNSGSTAVATGSNELVFGGLDLPSSSTVSVTAGSGWTLQFQDTNPNGSRAATEDGITAMPGPFAATFNLSGSANWAAIVASFRP